MYTISVREKKMTKTKEYDISKFIFYGDQEGTCSLFTFVDDIFSREHGNCYMVILQQVGKWTGDGTVVVNESSIEIRES